MRNSAYMRYHHIGYQCCNGIVHSVIVSTRNGTEWTIWAIPLDDKQSGREQLTVQHGLTIESVMALCASLFKDTDLTPPCIAQGTLAHMLDANNEHQHQRGYS